MPILPLPSAALPPQLHPLGLSHSSQQNWKWDHNYCAHHVHLSVNFVNLSLSLGSPKCLRAPFFFASILSHAQRRMQACRHLYLMVLTGERFRANKHPRDVGIVVQQMGIPEQKANNQSNRIIEVLQFARQKTACMTLVFLLSKLAK